MKYIIMRYVIYAYKICYILYALSMSVYMLPMHMSITCITRKEYMYTFLCVNHRCHSILYILPICKQREG